MVNKRNCPKNIKGLWNKTKDSNGKQCWKYNGEGYLIDPYIASKSVEQEEYSTKSILLNTNCILTSTNTNITAVTSVTDSYTLPSSYYLIEETKSSINVTLGADNTIIIKTGPKASVYYIADYNSSIYKNNFYTISTITLVYSKDGRTCSGTITVIH